jgi:hypothetical protein
VLPGRLMALVAVVGGFGFAQALHTPLTSLAPARHFVHLPLPVLQAAQFLGHCRQQRGGSLRPVSGEGISQQAWADWGAKRRQTAAGHAR